MVDVKKHVFMDLSVSDGTAVVVDVVYVNMYVT
jgi:hypothetical protein